MKSAKYLHRECLEDPQGTKYFFGRDGYVEIIDDVATAYITNPSAHLRDSRFSDEVARLVGKPQKLPVSQLGLKGMLEHLGVSPYAENQKKSALYGRFTDKNTPPQNAVTIG